MGSLSDQYRQMAAQARSDAEVVLLPNVQQAHLRSAQRFDQMAQEIENVANAKVRNEAAKVASAAEGKAAIERFATLMSAETRPGLE